MQLELNKMYKDHLGHVVEIIGLVQETSIEHSRGLRFFDGDGLMYHPDGSTGHIKSGIDLLEEVPAHEVPSFQIGRMIFNIKAADQLPDCIKPDHPSFRLMATGKYINRMGFLTHSGDHRFTPMGKISSEGDSMEDILYQII